MTITQKFINNSTLYKDYDFQARNIRRDEKINKAVAKENLLLFKKIFDSFGLNFFLLYGTVLGAVRENDFISHDTDTDIGIFEADRNLLLKVIPELLRNGFELIRTKEPDDLVTFMRNDEYIDIGIFSEKGKYYTYQGNLIDKYFLDRLDIIDFLGTSFLIPSNVEKFLVKNYGENWKTPLENEPALNLGIWNLYYRSRRAFFRTKFGQNIKIIIKKLLRRS